MLDNPGEYIAHEKRLDNYIYNSQLKMLDNPSGYQ